MTASDHLKHRTGSLGGDQDELESAPNDDLIFNAMRGLSREAQACLTKTVWKDGIDLEEPNAGCKSFVAQITEPYRFRLAKDSAALAQKTRECEELRAQVPPSGDGSCDHCGKVPSIIMPTSLCNECCDGVKRAEKAEAQVEQLGRQVAELAGDPAIEEVFQWLIDYPNDEQDSGHRAMCQRFRDFVFKARARTK